MRFVSRLSVWSLIAWGTLLCLTSARTAPPQLDRAKKVFNEDIMQDVEQSDGGEGRPCVVVLGENHASVKAQKQVARLIERLFEMRAVDCILIEGSKGRIDVSEFLDRMKNLEIKNSDRKAYWNQLLDDGRIAGYEYVALTRPQTIVQGVEDMEAKRRFEVEYYGKNQEESLDGQIASNRRAVMLFDAALLALKGSRDATGVMESTAAIRDFTKTVEHYNELAKNYRGTYRKRITLGHEYLKQQAVVVAALKGVKKDEVRDVILQNQEALAAFLRIREIDVELEGFAKEAETLRDVYQQLEDDFFIAANELSTQGAAAGLDFPELQTFYATPSTNREDDDGRKRINEQRAERDRAMVSNSIRFLNEENIQAAVLVVGANHVEKIVSELKREKVGVLAGVMTASRDPVELWERMAWDARREPVNSVFSSNKEEIKERTRLADKSWQREQIAKVDFLFRPTVRGLAGGGNVFENVGGKKNSVRVSSFPVDRNADVGRHVVDRGIVPGKRDQHFEVIDHAISEQFVKDLSDELTNFVFYRKTSVDDGLAYTFATTQGRLSFNEFVKNPPALSTRQVVMFGVPDEIMEGTVAVSPVWRELRVGGGGGGDEPPRWTRPAANAGGNGPPRRISLLRSINPERAKRKLDILNSRDAERVRDLTVIEEHEISNLADKLKFTPRRGDYGHVVVLVARNVPEFRAAVEQAGKARKLKNKQVALITCGDAFVETAALRETILRNGALMVWTPDRQLTPQAGKKLKSAIQEVPENERPVGMNELIERALENWRSKDPDNSDLKAFEQSGSWVQHSHFRTRFRYRV